MKANESNIVYLKLYKKKTIPAGQVIRLGEIAQLIVDEKWLTSLQSLVIGHVRAREGTHQLIDIMYVIRIIRNQFPQLQIEQFGDPHIVIERMRKQKKPKSVWVAMVWSLLFIGSGLAIMNFHEDVSMLEVHQRLYELLTGVKDETPRWIQLPYSIGIGIGMLVFFNHIFRKKINEEPSPLEVEMFTYEESIHQYTVAEEYDKKQRELLPPKQEMEMK